MLNFLLVLQGILLIVSIWFLVWARRTISRGVWWSFLIRDLLWLGVTLLQVEAFNSVHESVTMLLESIVEFAIICLLTYAIGMRYRLQRTYIFIQRKHQYTIEQLESMRTAEGW